MLLARSWTSSTRAGRDRGGMVTSVGGASVAAGASELCGAGQDEAVPGVPAGALRSIEDDRARARQDHAVLGVQAYGAGLHQALDVAADGHQLIGGVGVPDPGHVLLDDRPLVQLGGDEVGGRPDELHAPLVGLM